MTDDELYKVMEPYGAVQNCVILKDKDGVSKGGYDGVAIGSLMEHIEQ